MDTSASLDRVDNTRGYTPDNVVWLCRRCNTIKNAGTAAEHERIARFMRAHEDKQRQAA